MALDQEDLVLYRGRWTQFGSLTIWEIGRLELEDPMNPLPGEGIIPLKPLEIPITNPEYAQLQEGDILFLMKKNINGLPGLPDGVCVVHNQYKKAET